MAGGPEPGLAVKVDPSVVVDRPYDDAWINSALPNSNNNGANLKVGPASDGSQTRALLRFGALLTSGIPADAVVTGSALEMNITGTTTNTPISLVVRRLTKSWSPSSTTWNNPWTSAGGDMDLDLFVDQKTMGGSTGPVVLHPGRLVQKWIERDEANQGLMVRTYSGDQGKNNIITFASTEATDSSKWPKLTVDWTPRLGDRPFYTYEDFTINDRQQLKVNVANGNALLKTSDLNIASGLGPDIAVERYFNSHYNFHSHSGHNWRLGTGHDVELSEYGPDVVMKYPGNHHYVFWHNDDGGWDTPPGLRGDLTKTTSGYEFRFRDTDEVWRFAGPDLPRTQIEDRNNNALNFNYLTDGRLDKITNNEGQNVSFTYSGPNGELTKVQDWTGRYVQYTYSSTGGDARRLASYRDAAGNLVYYDYNSTGEISCITTGEGRQTKITYDSASSPRVTDVQRLDTLYTGTGDRCSSTSGPKWSFEYLGFSGSPFRGTTKVTEPRHQGLATPKFTKYTYNTEDQVEETKDALDNVTKSKWTTDSNVESYTDAAGTASGNPTRAYTFSYNTAGDVTGLKSASGAQSTVTYASSGSQQQLPKSYEDEQGNRWNYEYYGEQDGNGKKNNLKSVCVVPDATVSDKGCAGKPDSQTDRVTYTYLPNGNLKTIIDDADTETLHAYFADGNLQYVDHPTPLPTRSFTYDSLNRQATMVDGKGQTTAYTYDALDRVDVVTYKNSSGVTVGTIDYTYDADGNMTSRQDGAQEVVYDFNALNQQTLRKDKLNSTVQWETGYSYDLVGNLRFLTQNPGTVNENEVEYTYNAVSDVDRMFLPGKTDPIDFNYTQRLPTKTVFPNGAQITYGHTSDGKIASVQAGPSASSPDLWVSRTYSYTDPQGEKRALLQKMTDSYGTGEVVDYKYDGASRLDKALSNNGDDFDYDYDANGNLTRERVNGSLATQLTYHPSNEIKERIVGSATYTFTHDGNGNLTRERDPAQNDILTLNYNVRDQLVEAGDSNTALFSMAYNGSGQFERTQRDSTSYTHDLMGAGSEQTGGGTRTYYHRSPNGKIVAMQRGSNFYYYVGDYMGSILRVVNDAQSPVGVARYSYEPYGGTVVHNDSIDNPWRWAGGYHDSSVGLYKFGTRYYRPQIFRFTQQDPKAPNLYKPMTLNRWAYALDDPVNYADPTGQVPMLVAALVAGGVGIVSGFYVNSTISAFLDEVLADALSACVGSAIGAGLMGGLGMAAVGCAVGGTNSVVRSY